MISQSLSLPMTTPTRGALRAPWPSFGYVSQQLFGALAYSLRRFVIDFSILNVPMANHTATWDVVDE